MPLTRRKLKDTFLKVTTRKQVLIRQMIQLSKLILRRNSILFIREKILRVLEQMLMLLKNFKILNKKKSKLIRMISHNKSRNSIKLPVKIKSNSWRLRWMISKRNKKRVLVFLPMSLYSSHKAIKKLIRYFNGKLWWAKNIMTNPQRKKLKLKCRVIKRIRTLYMFIAHHVPTANKSRINGSNLQTKSTKIILIWIFLQSTMVLKVIENIYLVISI